jgi:hypothetical protein
MMIFNNFDWFIWLSSIHQHHLTSFIANYYIFCPQWMYIKAGDWIP